MANCTIDLSNLLTPFTADAVMNGGATLVGAFLGAMLAFVFQITIQRRQDRKASLLSTHRILFCLFQQINTLVLIQKDFIAPFLNSTTRFISIPATYEFDIAKDVFNFSTFSFMLESSESRKIMYDLYFAQESYIEALRALNDRSRLHRQEVQPRLAHAGIETGKMVALADIQKALGPLVYPTIVNTTNQTIEILQRTFAKLAESKKAFRTFAVKRFGTNDFTDFDFPETYGLATTA